LEKPQGKTSIRKVIKSLNSHPHGQPNATTGNIVEVLCKCLKEVKQMGSTQKYDTPNDPMGFEAALSWLHSSHNSGQHHIPDIIWSDSVLLISGQHPHNNNPSLGISQLHRGTYPDPYIICPFFSWMFKIPIILLETKSKDKRTVLYYYCRWERKVRAEVIHLQSHCYLDVTDAIYIYSRQIRDGHFKCRSYKCGFTRPDHGYVMSLVQPYSYPNHTFLNQVIENMSVMEFSPAIIIPTDLQNSGDLMMSHDVLVQFIYPISTERLSSESTHEWTTMLIFPHHTSSNGTRLVLTLSNKSTLNPETQLETNTILKKLCSTELSIIDRQDTHSTLSDFQFIHHCINTQGNPSWLFQMPFITYILARSGHAPSTETILNNISHSFEKDEYLHEKVKRWIVCCSIGKPNTPPWLEHYLNMVVPTQPENVIPELEVSMMWV
jgi:hypothetical protein